MPKCWLAILSLLALSACGEVPQQQTIGSHRQALLTEVTSFGSNPGSLQMFTYVPAGMPSTPAPIVVALHGCYQDAADYEAAGWNALADRLKFYVVYPQITANSGCFYWFDPTENARGAGGALSIRQMVDKMKSTYSVDGARVFVTGLSSGGAMAAAMLAAYPDVFSAGATLAGVPVGCATSAYGGFACMGGSQAHSAQEWGGYVRAAYSGYTGKYPRVSIWQGTSDSIVDFANFGELVSQWTNVQAIDANSDATETLGLATHREFRDGQGKTLVESWELSGMDHGAPVDPDNGCGTAGSYMLDVGICSSERIARFFGIIGAAGPDAGLAPGLDAGSPGLDAANPAGLDASDVVAPDAGEEVGADAGAGRDAGRPDAAHVTPVNPGQCNCGVSAAGGPESALILLALAGLLRQRMRSAAAG
ncbi:MAG TPA: PHB depolymerase family esterase [Myxococcales bacterium]|jgi:poly(hydroxyalkanoate) depolymerase family esterase